MIVITGAHKALALQKCIEGGVNHMWTLSSLQLHPHPMIVVDEDATLELQVKTVKVRHSKVPNTATKRHPLTQPQYFKSIEMVATELGFRQKLPRKRDSLVENSELFFAPVPQANSVRPRCANTRHLTIGQSSARAHERSNFRRDSKNVPGTGGWRGASVTTYECPCCWVMDRVGLGVGNISLDSVA